MKKYVKIILEDKKLEPIFLSLEKWESILDDPKILVKYTLDSETEWTGRSFNKSKIVASMPDEDYTKKANTVIHDLYHDSRTNTIKRFPRGTLPPPDEVVFYKIINPRP